MLYDEEGNVYIEPPLLPEEYHTLCVVKDYRRMSKEYWKMKAKVKRLQETIARLNGKQYSQHRLLKTHAEALRHCVKYMKQNGLEPSEYIKNYGREKLLWK